MADDERTPQALAAPDPDAGQLIVRNEFAVVAVTVRDVGSARPRLQIEDLRTQQMIQLDALELESLAWARHEDLAPLVDPGRRWSGVVTQHADDGNPPMKEEGTRI